MTVEDTIELVKRLMAGQKDFRDRDGYIHDLEVMDLLPPGASDTEKKAALLHGVLDAKAATEHDLFAAGVEPEVMTIVRLVSNGPNVRSYAAYVQKCRDIVASGNVSAMRIKLADMLAKPGHPTNNYAETILIMREGLGVESSTHHRR
jgi:(p)ppGpp synthase/HD superfamily hydrolase